ncbi:unnamed protein product [Orchesella dallaii]|uniref:Uncharacterized protein n=1 Tax=Orchesella dallaii TaxID=48710 RepID=A0ABP1QEV0_9HEXA
MLFSSLYFSLHERNTPDEKKNYYYSSEEIQLQETNQRLSTISFAQQRLAEILPEETEDQSQLYCSHSSPFQQRERRGVQVSDSELSFECSCSCNENSDNPPYFYPSENNIDITSDFNDSCRSFVNRAEQVEKNISTSSPSSSTVLTSNNVPQVLSEIWSRRLFCEPHHSSYCPAAGVVIEVEYHSLQQR